MKKPILEKWTVKWIFAWMAVCFIFWIMVFAGFYDSFKVETPKIDLTKDAWNDMLRELDNLKGQVQRELNNSRIPAGTVMVFNLNKCPDWWKIWTSPWENDDANRFLLPLQVEWPVQYWWTWGITINKENLPAHSHYIIWNAWGDWTVSNQSAIAISNTDQVWYQDYALKWTTAAATKWKTSEYWPWKPVTWYMPKYKRVLFCEKLPILGW